MISTNHGRKELESDLLQALEEKDELQKEVDRLVAKLAGLSI